MYGKRSNSHIHKRPNLIAVREEANEEESEVVSRRYPIKYEDFRKTSSHEKYVKLERGKTKPKTTQSSTFASCNHLTVMDPVYEVKEEAEGRFEQRKVINSPRVNYLTDYKEDYISPRGYYNSSFVNSASKYDMETNEVIAEDNNENLVENEVVKKRFTNHLKMADFIDKSDGIEEKTSSIAVNTDNIESIKEENIEEEDILSHKINTTSKNN